MLKKRVGFFIFGLLVFIVFAQVVYADQLRLIKPDLTTMNIGSQCARESECKAINVSKQYCQKTGTYTIQFVTEGTYTVDSYIVNWNSPQTLWTWLDLAAKGEIYGYVCENNVSMVVGNDKVYLCGYRLQKNSAAPLTNLFDTLSVSKTGFTYPSHDYACVKQFPDVAGDSKKIVECAGNDVGGIGGAGIYSTQTFQLGQARFFKNTGGTIEQGLIFNTTIYPSANAGYSAFKNIDPDKGRVELTIAPQWSGGTDITNRLFFDFTKDNNNYMRIMKDSSNNLICKFVNGTNSVTHTFPVNSWIAGQTHTVVMQWNFNSNNIFNCIVDGVPKTGGAVYTITPIDVSATLIWIGGSGASSHNSNIQLKIFDTPITPQVKYCSRNAQWITTLDSSLGAADLADKQLTCTEAGLHWIGTRCCSEAEDLPSLANSYVGEYYAEAGAPGGCWNSTYIPKGTGVYLATGLPAADLFATTGGPKLANINGTFYSCGITVTMGGVTYPRLNSCESIANTAAQAMRCKLDGNWSNVEIVNDYGGPYVRSVGWSPPVRAIDTQSGCCAQNQCFDGYYCRPGGIVVQANGKGYKCSGAGYVS